MYGKISWKKNVCALLLALALAFSFMSAALFWRPAAAEKPPATSGIDASEGQAVAYLAYIDERGNTFTSGEQESVTVTGTGTYTVSLSIDTLGRGLKSLSVVVEDGAETFEGYNIRVWNVKVMSNEISPAKTFTYDSNGDIVMSLYDSSFESLPEGARSYDKNVYDCNLSAFTDTEIGYFRVINSIEVEFSFVHPDYSADIAYLMYSDNAFYYPYSEGPDTEVANMTSETTYILGPGEYTVALNFTNEEISRNPSTLKFSAVNIYDGQETFPWYTIQVTSVKFGDYTAELTKGYTRDEETSGHAGIRSNIFSTYVDEMEDDARSYDGDTEGASPITISDSKNVKIAGGDDAYVQVVDDEGEAQTFSRIEVTFVVYEPERGESADVRLEYIDGSADIIYYGEGDSMNTAGITAETDAVDRIGTYTVGLDFTGTEIGKANGLMSFGIILKDAENYYVGYCIQIVGISVNGKAVETKKGVTYPSGSPDIEGTTYDIRYDIYTTMWSDDELPVGARSYDGSTRDVTAQTVDTADFENVETISVTFRFVYGEVVDDSFDFEAALGKDYNAYIALQTENYLFREEWDDPDYGLNGVYNDGSAEEYDRFSHITGWDASLDGQGLSDPERWIDYGGTFTDTAITGSGAYTVSLKLGDMGIGEGETYFRYLLVSTDIPSQLYDNGYIEFSNVSTKIDSQRAQDFYLISTETEYVRIVIISEYISAVGTEPFAYTMPTETITISFEISGLTGEGGSPEPEPEPEPTPGDSSENSGESSSGEGDSGCNGSGCKGIVTSGTILSCVALAAVVLATKKRTK